MNNTPTPAEAARLKAGFETAEKLAKRMKRSVRLVKYHERNGNASDDFAFRWARATGARPELVVRSPRYFELLEQGQNTGAAERSVPVLRLLPPRSKRSPTRRA